MARLLRLNNQEKMEILDIIGQVDLIKSYFKIDQLEKCDRLLYIPDPEFYFDIYLNANSEMRKVICSPGNNFAPEVHNLGLTPKPRYQALLLEWLTNLKNELKAKQQYLTFIDSSRFESPVNASELSLFTNEEKQLIKINLIHIRKEIESIQFLNRHQIVKIDETLDRIENKVDSLDRISWRELFIGAMISLAQQLALSPENMQSIGIMISQWFNRLFLNP